MKSIISNHNHIPSQDLKFSSSPRSSTITIMIFVAWFSLTATIGAGFINIAHIGPIYITEFLIMLLILENLNRLKISDLLFFFLLFAYIIWGGVKNSFTVDLIRDSTCFYTLLLARFMPRNIPKWAIQLCFASAFLGILLAILQVPIMEGWDPVEKYRVSILIAMLTSAFLTYRFSLIRLILVQIFWVTSSILIGFKTFMALGISLPVYYFAPKSIFKSIIFKTFVFGTVIFSLAFPETLLSILNGVLELLNQSKGILLKSEGFTSDSSIWRYEIWIASLTKLKEESAWIFGVSPGFNFINAKYLGTKFQLGESAELEKLRSPHNFLIYLLMKSGIVGVFAYSYFYKKWRPSELPKSILFFEISIFLSALTADVLERNSRGPLFLVGVWMVYLNQKQIKKNTI